MVFCPLLSVIVMNVASSFCHVHAQCLSPFTLTPVSSLPTAYFEFDPKRYFISW